MDAYQRRHRWAGLPLAVVYKFVDDQGAYLTALITYYGFVSLFPLLLLLVSGLGFALQDDPGLQQRVLDSALAQFPVIGDQIGTNIHSFHGSVLALATGILGSLYGGLGVVQATQNALNKMWGVPRNSRPNPVAARLRSLALLIVGGGTILATTLLSAVTTTGGILGAGARVVAIVVAIAVNVVLFTVAFRVLTAGRLTLAQVRAGAIAAALTWQILQWVGAFLLGHMLKGATATYGMFGIVLGLLAWIYLGALTFVVGAEINVVRDQRLWPRSLLTPFTDNVELTAGDRRAYTSYAETERHKGFQNVDVDFDPPPGRPD
ncbi:YihY/virulence factor BrkB family protein [Actinomadura rubrisoli]|uniref:YihY/virulence factor BrkB family protein n=1 Tax=Actinomadura rubrisoli TaxID=2530368 RepID=UPI001A9E48F0|nr:YihY/virulence factor BrkB family protein [Actinomadura rubrisoli]